jgi:hypothetical protein
MSKTQTSTEYHANAAMNHEKAAAYHDQAAQQHRNAAKLHPTSDCEKAGEHARQAQIYGKHARDSCRRAMEREGETNEQYGANTKKMYLHQRYSR